MLSLEEIQDNLDRMTDMEVWVAEVHRNGGPASLAGVELLQYKQMLADMAELELILEENGYDRNGYALG